MTDEEEAAGLVEMRSRPITNYEAAIANCEQGFGHAATLMAQLASPDAVDLSLQS